MGFLLGFLFGWWAPRNPEPINCCCKKEPPRYRGMFVQTKDPVLIVEEMNKFYEAQGKKKRLTTDVNISSSRG